MRRGFRLPALAMMAAVTCAGYGTPVHAQSRPATSRIANIAIASQATVAPWIGAFRDELGRLGRTDGGNMMIDARFANGDRGRLQQLVTELASQKPDAFLAAGEPALLAAKAHGQGIPVVTVSCDPLQKFMGSLAQPGGNATGFTCVSSDLNSKRLGLISTLLPGSKRVAVLFNPADNLQPELDELESLGRQASLAVVPYSVRSVVELDSAFNMMSADRPDALYLLASSFANLHRARIAELALAHRIPSIYGFREYAEAGGLMAYGAPIADGFRRAAHQMDKILGGAEPREVPVEQPTRFHLVVNARTAKTLGIAVPPEVLVQADEVIE